MFKRITAPELSKLKVVDESTDGYPNGFIEGYASVFGNVDLGGDVVMPGAFRKTLSRIKSGDVKYIDCHNVYEGTGAVIGVVREAKEDDYGLWFRAAMSSVQRAQDVRIKTKEGILNAISFGFDIIKDKMNEGSRQLLELKLWEISSVIWGMNPLAQATGAKSAIPFQDWATSTDMTKSIDPGAADRFQQWVSKEDPAEWQDADWYKFRRGFLWFNSAAPNDVASYKFLVVDVVDDNPQYIFRSTAAALGKIRAGGVAGDLWDADKDKLTATVKSIYAKFDQPFPDEKALIIDPVEQLIAQMKQTRMDIEFRSLLDDMKRRACYGQV